MKYTVSIAIDGRIDVEVEAEDFQDARQKAKAELFDADLDLRKMEIIGCNPVNAEDSVGHFIDY